MAENGAGSTLRQLNNHDLALYFRQGSRRRGTKTTATELLRTIEQEALPPPIYATFLTSVGPPCPLNDGLSQQYSNSVRRAAIRQFGIDLRSTKWKEAWEEVGGTAGLLSLFAQASVQEVKLLSKAIGRCKGRSEDDSEERKQRITELLEALLPSICTASKHKSTDQRPLLRHYAHMLPACTSAFVETSLSSQSHPLLEAAPKASIAMHHSESLRRLVLMAISVEESLKDEVAEIILDDFLPLLAQSTPPMPGAEPGFSAPMSFAVIVLERLATQTDTFYPNYIFLGELINPLMRRLVSRRVGSNRIQQITDLVIRYLERSPQAGLQLSFAKDSLISYLVKLWSQDSSMFEEQLITLIRMKRKHEHISLASYQPVLRLAKRPLRYHLLRMICLQNPNGGLDIDTLEGLKALEKNKTNWPLYIFDTLQQDHALTLLRRLEQVHPDGKFVKTNGNRSSLMSATPQWPNLADTKVLLTMLQRGTEDGESEAWAAVKGMKAKAAKSREQHDRVSCVLSALFHTIASGSLDLCMDVVLWMRQFQRDPKTVMAIYTNDVWGSGECVALLGSIPEDLKNSDAANIRRRITKANSIMLELLHSAVLSLREPAFQSRHWKGPLRLFCHIVGSRISEASRLKSFFHLPEDEIYDAVWEETLKMLLEAEKVGLAPEHELLGFNDPQGPLAFSFEIKPVEPPLPSSYRFLDDLARLRDKLWQSIRPTTDPAVAALESPWPKGLPIQFLMGRYNIATESAWTYTPFIENRATEVVFCEPAHALKEVDLDEETQEAVGQFVDSFEQALAIYVMQSPPGQERVSRVSAASSHALDHLSQRLMTQAEALAFWRPVFQRALPSIDLPRLKNEAPEDCPVIPTDIDPLQRKEWNPGPSSYPKAKSRKLTATGLDYMLIASSSTRWDNRHRMNVPYPRTEGILPPPIWSSERLRIARNIPPLVREGLILSAMLILASDIEGASRFLASPFPSADNIRYPALFLDEEFLRNADKLRPPHINVLSRLINFAPPTLLLSLADLALDALSDTPSDSSKLISLERTAYQILKLLSRSDRPQLASKLVIRSILDRPVASSWHRQLLTARSVRGLPANEAKNLLESFSSQICEKLETQASQAKHKVGSDASTTSPSPVIKVTTVKFLAKLLDDADFVSPSFTVDILTRVFQTATHIDIRAAVMDTLLEKLEHFDETTPDDLVDKLMAALQSTITVMGSLNERQPTRWVDEAGDTDVLPEIYSDGDMNDTPPILGNVLRVVTYHVIEARPFRKHLMEDVLLPAISLSTAENERWVRRFVRRHLSTDLTFNPPSVPVKPNILNRLLQQCYSADEIPENLLELYQQWILVNICPPPSLAAQIRKINETPTLRDSNAGKHYLSLYGRGSNVDYTIHPQLLTNEWSPSFKADGTRIAHIQDLVVQHAMVLLSVEGVSFSNWNKFIAVLDPPSHTSTEETENTWLANAKPVIRRIIDSIESMRTPKWHKSKDRTPPILPDTYDLQLWLFPYPHLHRSNQISHSSDRQTERCAPFAAEVTHALFDTQEGIYNLGLAHHAKLKSIGDAIMRCAPRDRIYLAWFIGPNQEDLDHVGDEEGYGVGQLMVKAELADRVLRGTKLEDGEEWREGSREELKGKKAIIEMLEGWKGCVIEDIRMRGLRLWEHYEL